jgi:hypothetical protein
MPKRRVSARSRRSGRSFRVLLAVKIGRAWRARTERIVTAATLSGAIAAQLGRSGRLTAASVQVEEVGR